tara:strand:+ start:84 stop:419 length:336 start_codon:yes stop_codon:yes gene_type:complete
VKQGSETVTSASLDKYEIVNDLLVIKWEDEEESYIPFETLRNNCPCAECKGETDALGNLYMGQGEPKSDAGKNLLSVKPVGYYALQLTWGDGHDSGIYRFELLKELGDLSG